MDHSRPVLVLRDVDIWRGERCLFRGLSLELDGGELALLVGPNGSGKTSLLRVLAGLAPCAAGEVAWNGVAITRLPPESRGDIQFRGHLDGLKKELTVEENLTFWARMRGAPGDLGPVLAALGLTSVADRPVRHLSAGQRRRAALAALELAAARLWLLDEPMTNLDSGGRKLVAEWLDRHLGDGGIAVVATHQPEELSRPGATIVEL